MTERRRRPDSRSVVLGGLRGLRQGRNLPDALADAGLARLEERDRAFAGRLAQHAVRHRRRLEAQMRPLLDRPPRDAVLTDLLWLGAAQIDLPDVPEHAAVSTTVALAPKRLRGLVNAVLRRRLREPPADLGLPAQQASLPDWLYAAIARDWGERSAAVIAGLNAEPALCLRVNRQRAQRDDYAARLAAQGVVAEPLGRDGLRLERSVSLESLPGYAEGAVSVQGAAAQCAAELLLPAPGLRVLDACAAPGGKTAHLLECEPGLQLTAVDIAAARLQRVAENLQRLGLQAELLAGDLQQDGPWSADYDRILLDAPCSGTGVIARHPDIKWLRRETDVATLAALQLALLQRCWRWLRPGGRLLYCTCSILQEENDGVVSRFLAAQPDARVEALNLPFGQASEYGWRIAPQAGLEGFFYARFIKP